MADDGFVPKLDAYVDGELPAGEMRAMDAHLRECSACAAAAVERGEMKRLLRAAATGQFRPSAEFRSRIESKLVKQRPSPMRWLLAPTLAAVVVAAVVGVITFRSWDRQIRQEQMLVAVTDLHVTSLASTNSVDVVSSDRHTVKPWFQGKLPFAFNLPELQGSGFTLVGGRMAYLDHQPGAQLILDSGKHHLSLFIFADGPGFDRVLGAGNLAAHPASFSLESWAEDGLRYFLVSDANGSELQGLRDLLRKVRKS